ncbi:glycosyltransferase, partial [Salmonella enterica subsp. enterica serovar Weltevreden]|nr:glycosyltransferase [Salmonella enterica subsp. enterica serovar Weltevreden]
IAGHSHLGLPGNAPGYFGRMGLSQEVSAVTGACLAMRAQVFSEVGGFDAAHLAVAFNDVDLCLKIRAAGYRIVWTPHARLVHHES